MKLPFEQKNMKHRGAIRFTASMLFLSMALVACNFSGGGNQPADASAIQTMAAQTIVAQFTQEYAATQGAIKTEAPTQTPMVVTSTPLPATPTSAATSKPTAVPPTATATAVPIPCDWAMYVKDVTYPDDTLVPAGDDFTKTWRIKNIGTCTWTTDYDIVFSGGDQMGGDKTMFMPANVGPGGYIDISVDLTAPTKKGTYQGFWKLRNSRGSTFGIGWDYNTSFWVKIRVKNASTPEAGDTPYYMASHTCDAIWSNEDIDLDCPGEEGDGAGFIIRLAHPHLEAGGIDDEPGFWVHPENVKNGTIYGQFPALTIQTGDHFVSTIGCLYNAENCNVMFQLQYSADGGAIQSLGSWTEVYDKSTTNIDIDLSSLVGKDVTFYLVTDANGSASGDDAFWLNPQVVH
jgi:hypothetical protein